MSRHRGERPADRSASPAICSSVEDLHRPASRRAIATHLEAWLAQNHATPLELLHSLDLARKLEASDGDLQRLVQRAAVEASVAGGGSVHEAVRSLHRLAEQALGRLQQASREAGPAPLGQERLQRHSEAEDTPEAGFDLARDLAVSLQGSDWTSKLERALDLADAAGDLPRLAPRMLGLLDQVLGELLASAAARCEILGEGLTPGARLTLLAGIAFEPVMEAVARAQPRLGAVRPPLSPPLGRLAGAVTAGAFPGLRDRLRREVVEGFGAGRRLEPADPLRELQVYRLLALVLTAAADASFLPEDARSLVVERSRLLLEPGFVGALAGPSPDPVVEVDTLVLLLENVAGDANRRRALKLLAETLATRRLQGELQDMISPGAVRRRIDPLRARIRRAGGDAAGVDGVLEALDLMETNLGGRR